MASRTAAGTAANPNAAPIGDTTIANAAPSAARDDAVSTGCARLAQAAPWVRMTKITRICVAVNSRTRGTECLRSNVEIASQQRERGNVKQ